MNVMKGNRDSICKVEIYVILTSIELSKFLKRTGLVKKLKGSCSSGLVRISAIL